jgi:hypothetical protein
VCDERADGLRDAHIRSIPSMISSRIANIAIPSTIATTSMQSLLTPARHSAVTIDAVRVTIV